VTKNCPVSPVDRLYPSGKHPEKQGINFDSEGY